MKLDVWFLGVSGISAVSLGLTASLTLHVVQVGSSFMAILAAFVLFAIAAAMFGWAAREYRNG